MSQESGRLSGLSTVVTGAASGIGRTIARRVAEEGALVTVADVDEDGGTETVEQLTADGHEAQFERADVTAPEDVTRLIEETVEWGDGIDVLVNNAGGHFGGDKLHTVTPEEFDQNVDVNLKGTFLCSREAVPYMARDGGGAMVHISSTSGFHGGWAPAYSSAKGGIVALSRLIATQYGTHGIRSNAVCPGVVETEGKEESMERRGGAELREEWLAQFPLGRLGQPGDVADAVAFLASDEAEFVSGTELVVDGGMTAGFDHDIEQVAFDIEDMPSVEE